MNFLSEDLFPFLLQYLSNEDQIQTMDCSNYYSTFKKRMRKVTLNGEKLTKCCNDETFLTKATSLMEDPGKQLIISKSVDPYKYVSFPFKKLLLLEKVPSSFISKLFSIEKELTIKTVEFSKDLDYPLRQPDIDCLSQMCELGLIENVRIHSLEHIILSIPYFPKIRSLLIISHFKDFRDVPLPASYASHLQKLHLRNCSNLDVSCLDAIPDLTIISSHILRGLAALKNNRRIQLECCVMEEDIDLSGSFINSEKISLYFLDTITLDLSRWRKVKSLSLQSYTHNCAVLLMNNQLPPTVRRCSLGMMFPETVVWQPFTKQLTEISLFRCDVITSLQGLGLEYVPVIRLEKLDCLTSLTGLGGRNRQVTVKNCPRVTDFSVLRSIDTVTIDSCAYFSDLKELDEVRVLELRLRAKLKNVNCLGKKTEVLSIQGGNLTPSCYHSLSKIPHLILLFSDLRGLLEYLKNAAAGRLDKLENETFTVYESESNDSSMKTTLLQSLYQQYLSSDYQLSKIKHPRYGKGSKYIRKRL